MCYIVYVMVQGHLQRRTELRLVCTQLTTLWWCDRLLMATVRVFMLMMLGMVIVMPRGWGISWW